MRLAIDVMGGDHAPDGILEGCMDGLSILAPDDRLVLVGDRRVIESWLTEKGVTDPRLEIEHAGDVIKMDDAPAKAVRSKPDSSIVKMARLGSSKAAVPVDGVLSAGNTGACVSAAIMQMRRLPGVHRPGICVTIPAFHGPVVMCDAGANPEPRATHLWQYALMAEAYARHIHGIENPRIGLMNIGSEEAKGTGMVKEASDLLRQTPGVNYVGFIEGRDFFGGKVDVVATDGFVGNTVLKMAEGLAFSLFSAIMREIMAIDPKLAQQFEPVVKQIYAQNDYHEYGGAPLMGVNGTFVIAHGSSQPKTIKAAIRNTQSFVKHRLNEVVVRRLAETAAIAEPEREVV